MRTGKVVPAIPPCESHPSVASVVQNTQEMMRRFNKKRNLTEDSTLSVSLMAFLFRNSAFWKFETVLTAPWANWTCHKRLLFFWSALPYGAA